MWVYFRRLASVSARTAVCSGLLSGVIPLSPSPSCQSPGSHRGPAKCQVTFLPSGLGTAGDVTGLEFAHESTARSSIQTKERALQFPHLLHSSPPKTTKRCLLQAVWPVKLGRCWRRHLPKALPLPCSHPGSQVHPQTTCTPCESRAATLPAKSALKEGISPST